MASFSVWRPLRSVFCGAGCGGASRAMVRRIGCSVAAAAVVVAHPLAAQTPIPEVILDSEGSAVIVPYYTVNEGWHTLVNVTNTSPNSLAVKFRLHESRNGRDVLNFSIALGPRDVWTAFIQSTTDGRPQLIATDRSCTIPLSVRDEGGAIGSEVAYSGDFADHSATDGDPVRTREGYIEILVMGETAGGGAPPSGSFAGDIAYFAGHVDGEPRDCGIVNDAFDARTVGFDTRAGTSEAISGVDSDGMGGTVQTGSGSPIARKGAALVDGSAVSSRGYGPIQSMRPLKVNTTLVNQTTGRAAGIESFAVAGYGVGRNLVSAQAFPWSMEPTLATGETLWTLTGLPVIAAGTAASRARNEWTSNANTGAVSEWVLTFPTKRFEDDVDTDNIYAACSAWRNGDTAAGMPDASGFSTEPRYDVGDNAPPPTCPDEGFSPGTFQDNDNGATFPRGSGYAIFDREEGSAIGELDGPSLPVQPPPEFAIDRLFYTANVIKIGRDVADDDSVLGSPVARYIETNYLESDASAGWFQMTLDGDAKNPIGLASDAVPMTGFLYKQRDFGDPTRNFGQATPHSYDRPQLPPATSD